MIVLLLLSLVLLVSTSPLLLVRARRDHYPDSKGEHDPLCVDELVREVVELQPEPLQEGEPPTPLAHDELTL